MPTTPRETYTVTCLQPHMDPGDARTIDVEFEASLTLAAGTLLGRVTATGRHKAYTTAAVDGSGVWEGLILQWPITTDASRNVSIQGDDNASTSKTAPAFWKGAFKCSDLTGLDTDAVADANARVILGSVSTGILIVH